MYVVFPLHLNPRVQQTANDILGNHQRIKLINPLNVIDFHNFSSRAYMILTDSGGIQEEAPSLGVPVIVLHDTTERPEGIEAGVLRLAGTTYEDIFQLTHKLLSDPKNHKTMVDSINPYGDGKASVRIVEAILYYPSLHHHRPAPFSPQ